MLKAKVGFLARGSSVKFILHSSYPRMDENCEEEHAEDGEMM